MAILRLYVTNQMAVAEMSSAEYGRPYETLRTNCISYVKNFYNHLILW